jgi:hypothetical protein
MHFEGHLASSPEEICDLFAEYIQRTEYTVDVWVPSDPDPEHVPDDPSSGALQFTSDEVESVLQDLDVNKGSGSNGIPPIILKNCASAFAKPLSLLFNRSLTGGRFHTLLRYSMKVGVTTLKTIVAWQFQSVLNCWFIEDCTTT